MQLALVMSMKSLSFAMRQRLIHLFTILRFNLPM